MPQFSTPCAATRPTLLPLLCTHLPANPPACPILLPIPFCRSLKWPCGRWALSPRRRRCGAEVDFAELPLVILLDGGQLHKPS